MRKAESPMAYFSAQLVPLLPTEPVAPIIIPSISSPNTATIIFLHGVDEQGTTWKPVATLLRPHLPHVKWVLPTAPVKPGTVGPPMNRWFDTLSWPLSMTAPEDVKGIRSAVDQVEALIDQEIAAGVPSERIALGGFSQGGALALYASLTRGRKLGGTFVLSSWLLHHQIISSTPAPPNVKEGRYFMGHGVEDDVVFYSMGTESAEILKRDVGIPARTGESSRGLTFKTYKKFRHASDPQELVDLLEWLKLSIPE